MAMRTAFTAYIKVIPNRGDVTGTTVVRRGGRFDYVRSLQHLAISVRDEIADNDTDIAGNFITLPVSGSGQASLSGQFGSLAPGLAAKPQFGESPACLMLEGFFTVVDANQSDEPSPATTCICAGETWSGQNGQKPFLGTSGMPVAAVDTQAKALKDLLDAALNNVTDATGQSPTVFRLKYRGVMYGDRGHHFPV